MWRILPISIRKGLITQGEKYNKVVDIWAKATDDIANAMMEAMEKPYVI